MEDHLVVLHAGDPAAVRVEVLAEAVVGIN